MKRQVSFDILLDEIKSCADGDKRCLVAIAGPPGSGKSTLAENLANGIGASAAVLPMDGFHHDNTTLRQRGLLDRKGAPETFDAENFVELVRSLKHRANLTYPTFDREADSTIPDGGSIDASSGIVLVEGNYLLLDTPPWSELEPLFDVTVYLDVPREELKARLIQRWINHGLSKADARTRAIGNDMRNVDLVARASRLADYTIR